MMTMFRVFRGRKSTSSVLFTTLIVATLLIYFKINYMSKTAAQTAVQDGNVALRSQTKIGTDSFEYLRQNFENLIASFKEKLVSISQMSGKAVDTNRTETAKLLNGSLYKHFQSAEEVDFPSVDTHAPRIPHIIHQIYYDEYIPEIYIDHVKSFTKNNPTWEYRFWTDDSGRKLLEKHHPYLLSVYDRFGSNVKRSDLLRYAVLYEFGGFYADFDVDNLRSLNRTTLKYACIVSVEPFEHSVLLYDMDYLINNAIMSCRPKHPFFKRLLTNLEHVNPKGEPVSTTGPKYITREFNSYNNIVNPHPETKTDFSSNSPYFYKGELKEDDENGVYVPNSQYFMDSIDVIYIKKEGKITKLCASIEKLTKLSHKGACIEYHRRKTVRENRKYTFTVHLWYHLWMMKKKSVHEMNKINIREVVPNCIFY